MRFAARRRDKTVELNKLVGRLRREITASPTKAAILGVLLLVAVVYWAPLVWSWIKPDEKPVVAKKTTPASASTRPVSAGPIAASEAPAGQTSVPSKHTWREVAEWIQNDPRMVAAVRSPGRDHPFDAVEPPAPVSAPEKDEELKKAAIAAAAAQSNVDPASVGLALSSTMVGPRGRAALINGRTYQLGDTIRLDRNAQSIEFRLTNILGDRVVVQRGERQYEVCLPEPTTSGRMEVRVLPDE